MANHCVIKTKKKVTEEEVDRVITPLIERFNGGLIVEKSKDEKSYGDVYWVISHPIFGGYEGVQFWIEGENHIEFRHGHGYPHFWFLEGVFRENLGEYFDGILIDEGVGEETKPNPTLYQSFEYYISNIYKGSKRLLEGETSRDMYVEIKRPIYMVYSTHYDKDVLRKLEVIDEFLH